MFFAAKGIGCRGRLLLGVLTSCSFLWGIPFAATFNLSFGLGFILDVP